MAGGERREIEHQAVFGIDKGVASSRGLGEYVQGSILRCSVDNSDSVVGWRIN